MTTGRIPIRWRVLVYDGEKAGHQLERYDQWFTVPRVGEDAWFSKGCAGRVDFVVHSMGSECVTVSLHPTWMPAMVAGPWLEAGFVYANEDHQ
jgi:hypothetical protein